MSSHQYNQGWEAFRKGRAFEESRSQDWKNGWKDSETKDSMMDEEIAMYLCPVCQSNGIDDVHAEKTQCPAYTR